MKILCIENPWRRKNDPMSVRPLLDIIDTMAKVPYSYERCESGMAVQNVLEDYRRRTSHQVIYLALHGTDGFLCPGQDDIDLETLADWMGDHYAGRVVHVASCRTLNKTSAARHFVEKTRVRMLTGYARNIDWLLSSGVDLFLLAKMAEAHGKPTKAQINAVWNKSPELFSSLGFVAFDKNGQEF